MNPMNPAEIRILVVDDDVEVAQGTARLLKQAGYITAQASNGAEALRTVQTFRPHLVLSDRDMPEMDGLEMCRRIKSEPASADVFVILISGTFTQSEEQSAGMESGADSYIARPIANRELAARVAAFVRIVLLNRALREKNAELEGALAKVKLLSGLVPICAGCKKIRDDQGFWSQVECYIQEHSEATFTHGLCPDCIKKYYPELEMAEPAEPREPTS
jgi:PleD family two-component response regulator